MMTIFLVGLGAALVVMIVGIGLALSKDVEQQRRREKIPSGSNRDIHHENRSLG